MTMICVWSAFANIEVLSSALNSGQFFWSSFSVKSGALSAGFDLWWCANLLLGYSVFMLKHSWSLIHEILPPVTKPLKTHPPKSKGQTTLENMELPFSDTIRARAFKQGRWAFPTMWAPTSLNRAINGLIRWVAGVITHPICNYLVAICLPILEARF